MSGWRRTVGGERQRRERAQAAQLAGAAAVCSQRSMAASTSFFMILSAVAGSCRPADLAGSSTTYLAEGLS